MTTDRKGWLNLYGADFLQYLVGEADWRAVEGLWRWASATNLPALAAAMAKSGDPTLAGLLGVEITAGRYSDDLPDLPDLLHEHSPIVSEEIAARILARLSNEENPLPGPYLIKVHLLVSWLMNQPGTDLDDLAIEIAIGGHLYSETPESVGAAIVRIARSAELGARLIAEFAACPDRWETGIEWTRTADIVARSGANPKGRAGLVRALSIALVRVPIGEAVDATPHFVTLMERHAAGELAAEFNGDEHPDSSGTRAAVLAAASFTRPAVRDDLAVALAAHQPTLWSAYRQKVYANWSIEDWGRMLARWAEPGSVLGDAGEVLGDAPIESDLAVVSAAIVHGTTPGDPPAVVACSAIQRLVADGEDDDAIIDAHKVVRSTPWDLVSSKADADYLGWILGQALTPESQMESVLVAYDTGLLSAEHAAALVPEAHWVPAFEFLVPGDKRAALAVALRDGRDSGFVSSILNEVIAGSDDPFDVIAIVAAEETDLAFGSFDEDRWHHLTPEARDQLVALLEQHATLDQVTLLDLIAADSEGSNSNRRAKAATKWAELAPLHGDIPTGIFSLLDSARPELNKTFASAAVTVQPRDETTLLRLREKWVSGGKIGEDAHTALEAIADGVVTTLGPLTGPARRAEGPGLLRILGVTAAQGSFDSLISHVGADAIDDDLGLRRASAAAIRSYVDATALDPTELAALGDGAATEPDAQASDHLREALAAARMGEDAAILLLYDIVGLTPSEVVGSPHDLFGDQKPRLLTALKRLVVQRELGRPGWEGYVEQMDLVAEALVRAAYLRFGDSESLKNEIKKNATKPDYGVLVKSFAKAKGFDGPSVYLQSLHDMRSNRTAAHHPNGGALDDDAIGGAVNALETAAREIIIRLQNNGSRLRAVESARRRAPPSADENRYV